VHHRQHGFGAAGQLGGLWDSVGDPGAAAILRFARVTRAAMVGSLTRNDRATLDLHAPERRRHLLGYRKRLVKVGLLSGLL
jgi:hypothetical protein